MRLVPFMLLLFLISCGPEVIVEESLQIDNSWSYDNVLHLTADISDTENKFDLLIQVDHDENFAFQNVYLQIKTVFPNGKEVEEPISLELSNKKGHWQSQCSGSNCSLQFFLQENFKFESAGKHEFFISQYSRDPQLEGIQSIQLKLLKATNG